MATNFLKYSGLTYDEIMQQINDKLNSDERFANFRESAIAQTLVEIFAGTADLVNYYIERRAEECFFDTAKLRSSVILLSRSLGYDVQRAVPASAKIKFKLKGNLENEIRTLDEMIQIPFQTVFTYEDQKYILKQTLEINAGAFRDDIDTYGDDFDSGWIEVDFKGEDIWLAQGTIKENFIDGETNPEVGSKFQVYRIDDTEFSNIYGTFDYDTPTTKVWVGNIKSDDTQYNLDRRSIINWDTLDSLQDGETVDVCVIRTSQTEGTEILFGDGRYSSLGAAVSAQGAQTSFDNIYIQYLATKGTKGNKVGLKDQKVNFTGRVFTSNTGQEVTDKIEFQFLSNPAGGADMETIDEIKANAPNIYYSLDRLVSKRDYVTYLKSLTTPINIKNAIAWGEREEILAQNIDAIQALFNIVFFCCVGPLYNINASPYSVKTIGNGLETAVLDFNYNPNEISDDSYYNVYTKTEVVRQLREYDVSATRWQIFSNEDDTKLTKGEYSDGATTITVEYTSDGSDYAPSLSGTFDVTGIDIPALKIANPEIDFLGALASDITGKLRAIVDKRGTLSINDNFDQIAFPGVTMIFDTGESQFQIRHDGDDICKITALTGTLAETMGYTSGIVGGYVRFSSTRELADNILTVLDLLAERAQVTINNIYISPIIHNFELAGTVYINALYDREAEKTKINNEIYQFLDTNADFNEEIFVSNLIEIIEKYPSVKRADVSLLPEEITGGPYFDASWLFNYENNLYGWGIPTAEGTGTPAIDNYPWSNEANQALVYSYTISANNEWNGTPFQYDTCGATERSVESTPLLIPQEYYNLSGTTLQSYEFKWKKDQTARNFFESLAKSLYDSLKGSSELDLIQFADSTNFNDLLSALWKDSVYMIRYNMLDTRGNLIQERDSNNNVIKGGYTIGSEIVKVNITASYSYAT